MRVNGSGWKLAGIKEVITALELCTNISQDGCMMLCPYKDEQDETYSGLCEHILKQDALELLKSQQAEIEELINEASGYAELLIKYGIITDDEQEAQRDYEQSVEYAQYCEEYEPTYNPEDGSM